MKRLVAAEALNMGVPVDLALAVAHAESNFDPFAESHKGARGVMQIMPATARGEYAIAPDQLWDPRINVRLGLHFLGRLLRRYRGRSDLALSYYNGGSAVGAWPHARVIPATRPYVARVTRLRSHYRRELATGRV
jgi:soluble lytic murein transglycosylase-like protein